MYFKMDEAINIFEAEFPDAQALFIFDQSSAHGSFANDALIAHKMNAGPGGAQPKMHETIIPSDNPNPELRGQRQSLVFPEGHELVGQPKGMIQVLTERGLYAGLRKNGKPPLKTCAFCKMSAVKQNEMLASLTSRDNTDISDEFYDGQCH
jgi:hypothetical protein